MHAPASLRKTQKIRRTPEIEAVGAPTMQFFLEGDALEEATRQAIAEGEARRRAAAYAESFENDNGETLTARGERLEPESTGKRGAAITLALLSSVTAIGVAGWMWMTPSAGPAREWLKVAAAPLTNATAPVIERLERLRTMVAPAQTPVVASALPAEPTPAEPTPAAATSVPEVGAEPPAPAPTPGDLAMATSAQAPRATAPVIELIRPASPVRAKAQSTEPPARAHASKRGDALRGYVWSPSAQAMVPNAGATTTTTAAVKRDATLAPATSDAPPANPDAVLPLTTTGAATAAPTVTGAPAAATTRALPAGPGIAPPSTGPAPNETARVPTTETEPAPFEAAPAKADAPIIE